MFRNVIIATVAIILGGSITYLSAPARAQTPGIISYQGRVLVNNAPFTGTGKFKFALVDSGGTTTFWSHDGTNGEPANTIDLTVTNGLYSVLLGDTTVTNMSQEVPESVFGNSDVRLRIWFNDVTNGNKLLAPDQRIAAVGYALVAKAVDTVGVTHTMVAPFPKAIIRQTVNQTIPTGTTTPAVFDAEDLDTLQPGDGPLGMFDSSSPDRFVCKVAGVYSIAAYGQTFGNTGGNRYSCILRANGATLSGLTLKSITGASSTLSYPLSGIASLNVGDVIDLIYTQDSGADISACCSRLSITKLP